MGLPEGARTRLSNESSRQPAVEQTALTSGAALDTLSPRTTSSSGGPTRSSTNTSV